MSEPKPLVQPPEVMKSTQVLIKKINKRMGDVGYECFGHHVEGEGYFFFIRHPTGEFFSTVFALLEGARRGLKRRKKELNYLVSYPRTQHKSEEYIVGVPFIQGWITLVPEDESGENRDSDKVSDE